MNENIKEKLKELLSAEEGQGMTEYGLILGLIALAAVGAMIAFGDKISALFEKVTGKLPGDTTPPE
ncbi:Flp family type IVb pilin [Neobacillus kokaensis]|uniref:Flp family type IVb pilin n=1 Tax=Neobacillus kokaensis TaxID=2759023 RepID=A0ABQ3MVI6_9BACI|nr:Flp family type IVb pilin [Neobacillus kokaensis]GHH96689.1 hypothetical protein AM1BK_02320 [Neobacillus kokaensis]